MSGYVGGGSVGRVGIAWGVSVVNYEQTPARAGNKLGNDAASASSCHTLPSWRLVLLGPRQTLRLLCTHVFFPAVHTKPPHPYSIHPRVHITLRQLGHQAALAEAGQLDDPHADLLSHFAAVASYGNMSVLAKQVGWLVGWVGCGGCKSLRIPRRRAQRWCGAVSWVECRAKTPARDYSRNCSVLSPHPERTCTPRYLLTDEWCELLPDRARPLGCCCCRKPGPAVSCARQGRGGR